MENKMKKDKLGTRDTMSICVQALIELESFLYSEGITFEKGEADELYDVLFKILKNK